MTKLRFALFIVSWIWALLFTNPRGSIMSDTSIGAGVNFVDHGTLEVDPHTAMDVSLVDGKFYSGLPPGETLLVIPIYFILKPLIAFIPDSWTPQWRPLMTTKRPGKILKEVYWMQIFIVGFILAPLFGICAVVLFDTSYRFTQSLETSLWVFLFFVFGMMTTYYATMYSHQSLAAPLMWISVFSILGKTESPSKRELLFLGIILGFCVSVDYLMSIGVGIVSLYLVLKHRTREFFLFYVLPLGVAACLILIYHKIFFHSFFSSPYHHRAWLFEPYHLTFKFAGESYEFHDQELLKRFAFEYPNFERLWGLSFSAYKGLFYFNPILVLGFMGIMMSLKDKFFLLLASLFGTYFFYNASLTGKFFWGGVPFFWGPRYLLIVAPFLLFGLCHFKADMKLRVFLSLTLFISLIVQLPALMHGNLLRFMGRRLPDELLEPLPNLFSVLMERGIRIPVLDIYQVPVGIQITTFLGVFAVIVLIITQARKQLE